MGLSENMRIFEVDLLVMRMKKKIILKLRKVREREKNIQWRDERENKPGLYIELC